MKQGRQSFTAEMVACYRAFESMRPEGLRICYDPLAAKLVGTKYMTPLTRIALFFAERIVPGHIGEVIVRTRYIDDYLRECIGNGIRQLVILGAGYDSRAYRFDGLKEQFKVFEIDHPATQNSKIEKIKKIFGSLPDHVVYVPIDFDKENLAQRLFEIGYDKSLKTLFIWEGVTPYLAAEAVDETLAFVANNSGQGSSIIFNYIYRSVVDGTCELKAAKRQRTIATRIGEHLRFGIEEGKIEEFLSSRGFCQIRNAGPEFLESTYFTGANQGRKTCPYASTVHAAVKPRG